MKFDIFSTARSPCRIFCPRRTPAEHYLNDLYQYPASSTSLEQSVYCHSVLLSFIKKKKNRASYLPHLNLLLIPCSSICLVSCPLSYQLFFSAMNLPLPPSYNCQIPKPGVPLPAQTSSGPLASLSFKINTVLIPVSVSSS